MFAFFEISTFQTNTEREDNNTLRREARDLVTFICVVNRAQPDRVLPKDSDLIGMARTKRRKSGGKRQKGNSVVGNPIVLLRPPPAPFPHLFPHL